MSEHPALDMLVKAQKEGKDVKEMLELLFKYREEDGSVIELQYALYLFGALGHAAQAMTWDINDEHYGQWLVSVSTEPIGTYEVLAKVEKLLNMCQKAKNSVSFGDLANELVTIGPEIIDGERRLSTRVEMIWHQPALAN